MKDKYHQTNKNITHYERKIFILAESKNRKKLSRFNFTHFLILFYPNVNNFFSLRLTTSFSKPIFSFATYFIFKSFKDHNKELKKSMLLLKVFKNLIMLLYFTKNFALQRMKLCIFNEMNQKLAYKNRKSFH